MDPDFYYRRPAQLPPATPAERDLAWRCEVCGYHVLSMDQSGKGLPLEAGPSGQIVPLTCPRCTQQHPHWTPVSPFDAFGDHANVPSALSSRVTTGASIFESYHKALEESRAQSTTPAPGSDHNNNSRSTSAAGRRSPSASITPQQGVLQRENNGGGAISVGLLGSQSISSSSLPGHASAGLNRSTSSSVAAMVANQQQVQQIGARVEFEYLADHEALKDPDVVEALQRLRRRKGAYFHQQNDQQNQNQQQQGGRFTELYKSRQSQENYTSYLDSGKNYNSTTNRDNLTDDQIQRLPESSLQRAAAHRVTAPKALECYVCSVCNRRLLRIDHKGELIPIESDAQGNLTAIECPGCHQTHSRWLRVKLNGTSSSAQKNHESSQNN